MSNFGVHHLQELEAAGLPQPAVNQAAPSPRPLSRHMQPAVNQAAPSPHPLSRGAA